MTENRPLRLVQARTSGRALRGVTSLVTLGLAVLLVPMAVGVQQRLHGTGPFGTGGTLLAIDDASITIGPRPKQVALAKAVFPKAQLPPNLTCHLGRGSPALADFHVGEYVAVRCSLGKLSAIQPDWQWAGGKIVMLGANSIEIGSSLPSRPGLVPLPGLRCSFGPGSPRADKYHVGDEARMGCLA